MSKKKPVWGLQPTAYERLLWVNAENAEITQLTNQEITEAWIEARRGEPDWDIEHKYKNIRIHSIDEEYVRVSYIEKRFFKYIPFAPFPYSNYHTLIEHFTIIRDGIKHTVEKPQWEMPEILKDCGIPMFDTLEEAEAYLEEKYPKEHQSYLENLNRVPEKKTWRTDNRRFLMPQREL